MKFLNRYFFIGVLVGSVLTVAIVTGFGVVFISSLAKSRGESIYLGGAPEFPEAAAVVASRKGDDWTVRDLEGRAVSLREQHGRVVFLNLWATWCKPCVAEMPSIQALYDSLHAEGVEFALVTEEEPAKVKAFVREKSFRAPVYVCEGKPPAAYRSVGIPATFILDRAGGIVAEHVGAVNWDVERCRRFLRGLLASGG